MKKTDREDFQKYFRVIWKLGVLEKSRTMYPKCLWWDNAIALLISVIFGTIAGEAPITKIKSQKITSHMVRNLRLKHGITFKEPVPIYGPMLDEFFTEPEKKEAILEKAVSIPPEQIPMFPPEGGMVIERNLMQKGSDVFIPDELLMKFINEEMSRKPPDHNGGRAEDEKETPEQVMIEYLADAGRLNNQFCRRMALAKVRKDTENGI